MAPVDGSIRIGVLALQGSFREHMALLSRIPGVCVIEVRSKDELHSCSGLIIPGGESTTMALVAERWGLIPELQKFHKTGRPIWGTCAGMIFLAERAEGQKKGGQALLGGLDITVSRNFFGAQINSFETYLPANEEIQKFGQADTFRAVFIRAPGVLELGPNVESLAEYTLTREEAEAHGRDRVVVAVRSGVLLATAFHPELTADKRWHQLFVDMVRRHSAAEDAQIDGDAAKDTDLKVIPVAQLPGRAITRPLDLPIFGQGFLKEEALI
eukprot:CAMPEP_0175055738 /NCGR_PEP_ID=MMETSP0052_2-20121109/10257_1 /TAXON_ID=51329 ORGANISM="Polytomella parva, Strain SAG 63-3" /NCGR_SAMPLE_ID=MMETSP0052_2 /ASSEMBLY_ACC=CAM_ASM_000194 /LENGTH=269 /DNA_ID=CAMNT_0016320637 /DNA_START=68 /DNA_END=877 /DNA_ORIENTATION=+